jgi:hypothetical protein
MEAEIKAKTAKRRRRKAAPKKSEEKEPQPEKAAEDTAPVTDSPSDQS